MHQHIAPLDTEPVSVLAPFVHSCPDGLVSCEPASEHHAALLAAVDGVELGTYGRILHWPAGWAVHTVAVVVSLLWRVRHAGQLAHQDGGEPR